MTSVDISKLSLADLIFVDPGVKINGGYYSDMLLSQHLLPVMCDVSGNLSTRQRTYTPGTRHCDFLSSQYPLSFFQICGRRIAATLIRSITRYRATSSNKCISRSCTAGRLNMRDMENAAQKCSGGKCGKSLYGKP